MDELSRSQEIARLANRLRDLSIAKRGMEDAPPWVKEIHWVYKDNQAQITNMVCEGCREPTLRARIWIEISGLSSKCEAMDPMKFVVEGCWLHAFPTGNSHDWQDIGADVNYYPSYFLPTPGWIWRRVDYDARIAQIQQRLLEILGDKEDGIK